MHQMRLRSRQPALAAIAVSSLMAIGLAACGSSSSSPTTATQANAAATSTTGAAAGNGATGATSAVGATGTHRNSPARVSAVRNCLQRNGIKLPAGGSARGLFLGGGLPKGATATQLRAAMRKCLGGTGPLGRAAGGHFLRTGNPRFKQALAGFASCMRKNGVNVPSPNTSGKGPVFSTKGLNTESAQFKAAAAKCRPLLSAGFRRPAGAAAQPTG